MSGVSLIGMWDLERYEVEVPGEAPRAIWESMLGRLVYSRDGSVSVLIVRTGVPELKNSEVIAYSGRYRIQENLVTHDVYVSNLYHYIGKSISRKVEVVNSARIVLTTLEQIRGATHRVTWKKTF